MNKQVELKPGDSVLIYHDPITRQSLEGKAVLHSQYRPDEGDGLELWKVVFYPSADYDDYDTTYIRTIYKG